MNDKIKYQMQKRVYKLLTHMRRLLMCRLKQINENNVLEQINFQLACQIAVKSCGKHWIRHDTLH